MLRTNEERVVEVLLQCQPGPPRTRARWNVDHEGVPFNLPSIGGISVNIGAGDPAFGWAGDHLEPSVSCTADTKKPFEHPNVGLQFHACAGNRARLISGAAKGSEGYVLGHHGGSEHVIAEFPRSVKERMSYDDKIIIHGRGQGLTLSDYPQVSLFNLDPRLLGRLSIEEADGALRVPVTTKIPAACMGSGVGATQPGTGDYDIMTSDPDTVAEYKLDRIRLGDFVALVDHDNRFGRAYRRGAVTIGIVVHSDCLSAGHGPGVTTLITCAEGTLVPVIDPAANISDILGHGNDAGAEEGER
jgi:hypothetical protein